MPSWMLPGLCALLIAAVWLLGIGRDAITFEKMDRPETLSGLKFRGDVKSFYTEQGDEYGVLTSGPYYDLPVGSYHLNWVIETDAPNTIRITSSNGARVEPSEITVPENTWSTGADFEILEDAMDVQFQIVFGDGTYLRVQNFEMRTREYTDNAFTLTFLILAVFLLMYLSRTGRMDAQRWCVLLILGMAAIFSIIPSLKPTLNLGHDSEFHLIRIRGMVDGLLEGQLPVRVDGYAYMGYGSALSVFYPGLFCYFPALLMLAGASMAYAVNAFLIGLSLFTALSMYLFARRVLGSQWRGVCASVLYTLAPYRIMDMYTRFAIGEVQAMAMLPLFLWGLYEVFFGEKRRWPLLVLGATCVFHSHILTTGICAVGAVVLFVCLMGKLIREKRLGAVFKAVGVTLLLNVFFLAPLVSLSRQGANAAMLIGRNSQRAVSLAQLMIQSTDDLSDLIRDTTIEGFAVEIGAPLMIGGMLALCAACSLQKGNAMRRKALLLCAIGAAFTFAATPFFPWESLSRLTQGMSDYLQFPWRLVMMADIALALAGGIGICALAEKHGRQAAVLTLVAAVYIVMPHLTKQVLSNRMMFPFEITNSNLLHPDYLLPETDQRRMIEQEPLIHGELAYSNLEKRGTHVTAQVDALGDAVLELPLYGFDGYAAEVNGERMEIGLGDNNRLAISLPAGTSGQLRVWYEGKAIWRVFDGISLLTLAGLAARAIRSGLRKRRRCAEEKTA